MDMNSVYERLNARCSKNELWWLFTKLKFDFERDEFFAPHVNCVFVDVSTKVDEYIRADLENVQKLIDAYDRGIRKVIFNPPATIIFWNNGTKTVVKAQNGEPYDPEKGFVMAYLKRLLGNDNTFNKEIHKWVK